MDERSVEEIAGEIMRGLWHDVDHALLPKGQSYREAAVSRIAAALRAERERVTTDKAVLEMFALRPSVAAFAWAMEGTLRKHDAKKGGQTNWRKDHASDLIRRIEDELIELKQAETPLHQAMECIDVANFCLMVYDVLVGLPNDAEAAAKEVQGETM